MCPTSRKNFQTYLPPVKPGGALLNLSPVYTPLPSLQIAPQPTQLVRRQNVSILCLHQNLSPQPLTQCIHLSPSYPTAPVVCRLLLRRWESFWQSSTLTVTGPDGISSHILKTCSAALALPLSALSTPVNYHRSSSICLEISQHHSITLEGTKTDPLNCRPISLLPIIIKVMESIIAVDLKSFLFSKSLISYHQFRFKLAHSPLGMLLDILDT